jgi:hypothetical protein
MLAIAFLRFSDRKSWIHEALWKDYASSCQRAQVFYIDSGLKIPRFSKSASEGMVILLNQSRVHKFDYYHFITDSCLPLYSCGKFEAFLKHHSPASFVKVPKTLSTNTFHHSALYALDTKMYMSIVCKTPKKCMRRRNHHTPSRFRELVANGYPDTSDIIWGAPEEFMFAEYVAEHNVSYIHKFLTYVNWDKECRIPHGHPCEYEKSEWPVLREMAIKRCPHCFFARKFVLTRTKPDNQVRQHNDTSMKKEIQGHHPKYKTSIKQNTLPLRPNKRPS